MKKIDKKADVLIVEDDMILSMVEERLVKKLGYNVVAKVQSGSEAIKKVSENNPDVIIMDISLKGDMDGVETMREIRKKVDTPVIFLSGRSSEEEDELTGGISYSDFLTKPISSGDLKGPMQKAISLNAKKGSGNEHKSSKRQLDKTV